MEVKKAYNIWAAQYDTNDNKTRDLEARSLRGALSQIDFQTCLEIGCGTGKNTEWLAAKSTHLTAVDLSEEMLEIAKQKNIADNVEFQLADINNDWTFTDRQYDLITFSLVLEHIENLNNIFKKTSKAIKPGGLVYIGELHPFKQYAGSKARFDTESVQETVNCFNHNISDFTQSAIENGFELVHINEYFDDDDRTNIPRIMTLLLEKKDDYNNKNRL